MLGMNALRRPHTRHAAILSVNLPSSIFLQQEMVSTAPAEASTMVPYVYQRPCPVSVEAHGGNVKEHRSVEGKAIGNTRSLLNRFEVCGADYSILWQIESSPQRELPFVLRSVIVNQGSIDGFLGLRRLQTHTDTTHVAKVRVGLCPLFNRPSRDVPLGRHLRSQQYRIDFVRILFLRCRQSGVVCAALLWRRDRRLIGRAAGCREQQQRHCEYRHPPGRKCEAPDHTTILTPQPNPRFRSSARHHAAWLNHQDWLDLHVVRRRGHRVGDVTLHTHPVILGESLVFQSDYAGEPSFA